MEQRMYLREWQGVILGDLPAARTLPMHAELTQNELARVAQQISAFYRR